MYRVNLSNINIFKKEVLLYLTKKNCDSGILAFFSSTFVYKQILLKISMKANIVKTQIFHEIKYDLKGHSRSQQPFYF